MLTHIPALPVPARRSTAVTALLAAPPGPTNQPGGRSRRGAIEQAVWSPLYGALPLRHACLHRRFI